MPRIILLAERFPPDIGGVASSASRISRSLCQLDVEVDVLVWSRYLQPGQVSKEALDSDLQVYRVGQYRHWDMTMINTLNVLDWLKQKHDYDAVWGHYLFPSGFLAIWFASLNELPSIVSARGNDVDRAMFPPGDFARLQWTLKQADTITVVSQDLARKIEVLAQRDDIFVIKNAVDTGIFTASASIEDKLALRRALGIADSEVVLGFSGELRQKKGQDFLLQCLTRVRQNYSACLLIIGEVRASQEAVLQSYSLQFPEDFQRVVTTGHLSEPRKVAQHLQICDVFLMPSLWEGLPNALLEAMACGCVCIASDAGGIPDVIEDKVNGFMLPRGQLNYLGEAVLELLALDAQTRQQISQPARDRILEEFSLEAEKDRLQAVLEQVGIKF